MKSLPWLLAAFASILLAAAAPGQSPVWKLPDRGVVFYNCKRNLEPGGPGGLPLPGFEIKNPPLLCQGELDPSQRFVKEPPAHLWELAQYLAFDLRQARGRGKLQAVLPWVQPYGSIHVQGTLSPIAKDGSQTLEATVTRQAALRGKTPENVYQGNQAKSQATLAGSIKIRRVVDKKKGLVTEFQSSFTGRTKDFEFELEEDWKLDRVEKNRYPAFAGQVADAIQRGAENIKDEIRNLDMPPVEPSIDKAGRSYSTGRLALALLTLLKAEVDREDPVLKAGFASLRRRVVTDTYALASALMAIEALYAPADERRSLIEGRLRAPVPRKPSAEDLALMEKWTEELLTHTDGRVKQVAYLRRYHYMAGTQLYDNSNSQYALLGLYSAQLCGVPISPRVWHANAAHWLEDQWDSHEGPVYLKLVSHREYRKQRQMQAEGKRSYTVTRGKKVRPAGWAYTCIPGEKERIQTAPLTGSMTTAGITGVTICQAVLQSLEMGDRKELLALEKARRRGYAWMLKNFSVRNNKNGHATGFHYYYLFGLERACELGQVALIGNRDWYFEGSLMLMGMQDKDGHFQYAMLSGNCFAVLFLKLAAPPLPVLTGGR